MHSDGDQEGLPVRGFESWQRFKFMPPPAFGERHHESDPSQEIRVMIIYMID